MAAGQQFTDFRDNFETVLGDVRAVRREAESFANDIAPAVAAAKGYKTFKDIVEVSDFVIDKAQDSLRLAEKAGPLSAPAKALREALAKIEPRVEKIKKATDEAKVLNAIADVITNVDDKLSKTILPGLEETDTALGDTFAGVEEIHDAFLRVEGPETPGARRIGAEDTDALSAETDAFVAPVNAAADGYIAVRDAYLSTKEKLGDVLDTMGVAKFEQLASAFADLLKFDGLIGKIDEITDVVDALLKPVEPLLDMIDTVVGYLVDPVLEYIVDTLGIDEIFDKIAEALDPLFPKVEIFDGLKSEVSPGVTAGETVLGSLTDFSGDAFEIPDFEALALDTFDIFAAQVDGPPLRIGDASDETILGTGGHEAFDPRGGNDVVRASAGNDIVVASAGNDTIYGGDGEDRIVFAGELVEYDFARDKETGAIIFTHTDPGGHGFNEGSEVVFDVEYFDFGTEVFTRQQLEEAVAGPSVLDGFDPGEEPGEYTTDKGELIFLQNGGTKTAVEVMWEHAGEARVSQFSDMNAVYGLGGDDRIQGTLASNGRDYIDGGPGNDLLVPRTGEDVLNGGTGNDTFQIFDIGFSTFDRIYLDQGESWGQAFVRGGTKSLFNIENVINLQQGKQYLHGNDGPNRLVSSWDRDVVVGFGGDDVLSGNGREDVLFGGLGADTIYGGDFGDRIFALDTSDNGRAELYAGEDGVDLLSYSTDQNFLNHGGDLEKDQYSHAKLILEEHGVKSGPLHIRVDTGEIDRLDAQGRVIATDIAESIEKFVGSDSDDTVEGAQFTDEARYEIYGAGGNDDMVSNGAFVTDGGDGDDYVTATLGSAGLAGASSFYLEGGAGFDTLDLTEVGDLRFLLNIGNNQVPQLRGWDGELQGTLTNGSAPYSGSFQSFESIWLGDFADRVIVNEDLVLAVRGGGGNDLLETFSGSGSKFVTFHGEAGDDEIQMNSRGVAFGGADNDTIRTDNTSASNDGPRNTLDGGAGDDVIVVDRAKEADLHGGAGYDRLAFDHSAAGVTLDLASQTAAGKDVSASSIRNLKIDGFEEYVLTTRNDTVIGTDGSDRVILREGSDSIFAGAGDDLIFGGEGRDSIDAGTGDDTIAGGTGDDTIDGGDGIDALDYALSSPAGPNGERQFELSERVLVNLAEERGGRGSESDTIRNIEQVYGTIYDDRIVGDAKDNLLSGGNGFDVLHGAAGDDVLIAGGGVSTTQKDVMFGGSGDDHLIVGVGRFEAHGDSGGGAASVDTGSPDTGPAGRNDRLDFSSASDPLDGGGRTISLSIDLQAGTLSREIEEGRAVWAEGGGQQARSYDGQSLTPDDILRADASYARLASDASVRLPDKQDSVAFGQLSIATELTQRIERSGESSFSEIEHVTGTFGADTLFGDAGTNALDGGDGDDVAEGRAGNDTIDGGDGAQDIAAFSGRFADYSIALSGEGHIVDDKRADGTGTDLLHNVERLSFGDGASFVTDGLVDLTSLDGVVDLGQAELRYFVEMYIAYFDRAPDSLGLFYWGDRLEDGMTMAQIARSFFVQPESKAAFPDAGDNAKLVDDAYNNLLERDAEDEGRDYWIGELGNGNVSGAEFMLALINGAKADTGSADDVRTLQQKADIGISYAVIEGLNDLDNAAATMEAYDRTDAAASLGIARSLIEGYAAQAGQAGSDEVVVSLAGVADDPFA